MKKIKKEIGIRQINDEKMRERERETIKKIQEERKRGLDRKIFLGMHWAQTGQSIEDAIGEN